MGLALITAASSDIGRSIAMHLADDGNDIIFHYYRNKECFIEMAKEIEALGRKAVPFQADLGSIDTIEDSLVESRKSWGGFPNILVNCAGKPMDGPFVLSSRDELRAVTDINLHAPYLISKWFMRGLERGTEARIVNIGSIAGQLGNSGQVAYSAAKAGLLGLTKALAQEAGRKKITVNCVCPGIIETKMTRDVEYLKAMKKRIPLRRFGKPAEVAAVVSFLCSDKASYITGQSIHVNGGLFCQ